MRRKFITRLSTLLIILSLGLCALSAEDALTLTEGSAEVFNPYGERIDSASKLNADGYFVRTKAEGATFSSPFGSIKAEKDSIIALTNFNLDTPSIYVLTGDVSVDLTVDIPLTIYTSTSAYQMKTAALCRVVYTDTADYFYNLSEGGIIVIDPARGKKNLLPGMTVIDMLTGKTDTLREKVLVEGVISYGDYKLGYDLYSTHGSLEYPAFLTESEIQGFFEFLYKREAKLFEGAVYTFTEKGKLEVQYGTELDKSTLEYIVKVFTQRLKEYLDFIFTDPDTVLLSGSITYKDIVEVGYELKMASGSFNLPEFITVDDVNAFDDFIYNKNPQLAASYAYTFEDNVLTVDWFTSLYKDELRQVIDTTTYYLNDFLASIFVPAAPMMNTPVVKDLDATILYGKLTYGGFAIDYDFKSTYGYITVPAFVSYDMIFDFDNFLYKKNPRFMEDVSFSIEDQTIIVDYGTELNEAELKWVINGLALYLKEYIERPLPAAPAFASAPVVEEILLEGSFEVKDITINYELRPTRAYITYPYFITAKDAESFLKSAAEAVGSIVDGVTYMTTDGATEIFFGTELTKDTLEFYLDLFKAYLEEYLEILFQPRVPETPSFKSVITAETQVVPAPPVFVETEEVEESIPAAPVKSETSEVGKKKLTTVKDSLL